MLNRIFIDIDGVLADFMTSAFARHGVQFTSDTYPDVGWDCVAAINTFRTEKLSPSAFWKPLSDHNFWATLPLYPHVNQILNIAASAVGKKHVYLVTAATSSPFCNSGKVAWIQNNLPKWIHRQYFISSHKHLLASPEALLIDDSDANIKSFSAYGGNVILVPQPWNTARNINIPMYDYVTSRLFYIIKRSRFNGE